jgi:hypothetical protein
MTFMDNMANRNNRPAQRPQSGLGAAAPQPAAKQPYAHASPRKSRRRGLFIATLVVLALLLAAAAWFTFGRSTTSSAIDGSKYQAVFFTNGQVYFGKLSPLNDDYMRLESVYYLQNKEQAADETSPQSASSQDASDVELIKLGNEIHGPEDEMLVAKDQILFFENLKPAGTVSKTITEFQQK